LADEVVAGLAFLGQRVRHLGTVHAGQQILDLLRSHTGAAEGGEAQDDAEKHLA
jgi:hypothetical protein